MTPGDDRLEITGVARDFRAIRYIELAQRVAVIGDTRAPFMAPPDTDPSALRAADSLVRLPDDPAAAAEAIQQRREEIGFSYFVFGLDFAEALAPVVAKLAGHQTCGPANILVKRTIELHGVLLDASPALFARPIQRCARCAR